MSWLPYHHDWKLLFQIQTGLRVHWFGRYAGYPKWSIPTSRLAADMLLFFFVEKNRCWTIVNGRKISLNAGDLLVISGADQFSFGYGPGKPQVILSASLALQQGDVTNALLRRQFERRYTLRDPRQYTREFDKVLSGLANTSAYRDLHIAGVLLQWLAYVLSQLNPPLVHSSAQDRGVVDKILTAEAWATTRLRQTVTLAEWARALKLNPVYFGRIFKAQTGLRPMEWLNQRRLQMASQYLSSTDKSVAEIADDCGFSDQFYFSRTFRRHFGLSPLKYRKRHF